MRELAEPLASFDRETPVERALKLMQDKDFDLVGVRDEASVAGYVLRQDLVGGVVGDYLNAIDPSEILHENAPLSEVLEEMASGSRWVFVSFLGTPSGIVTLGDLQKAPMRMWLFGLISLFEMQLLKRIKQRYPDHGWESAISPERFAAAQDIHVKRVKKRSSTYLVDCLQLGDKGTIFKKEKSLLEILRNRDPDARKPISGRQFEKFMGRIEILRNDLAHSSEIGAGDWSSIADDVAILQGFLKDLESSDGG